MHMCESMWVHFLIITISGNLANSNDPRWEEEEDPQLEPTEAQVSERELRQREKDRLKLERKMALEKQVQQLTDDLALLNKTMQ